MSRADAQTPLRLILFDCDGTLTDSHPAIIGAMRAAFADAGLPAPEAETVAGVIGLSLDAAVASLLPAGADARMHAAVVARYRAIYRDFEGDVRLFDGVPETLDALAGRGFWLGIVTGKSRAGLLRTLARFDLASRMLVWRTADCCPSKPHPAMVLECADEMGVPPAETLVVGDAAFDMQMARAAGARAIGVDFGQPGAAGLREAGAETVVTAFPALLSCVPPLSGAPDSGTMSGAAE